MREIVLHAATAVVGIGAGMFMLVLGIALSCSY